ncbi:MAG: hypothetical protein AB4426_04265 [Xenococcaceae cyanobacterium]
MGIFKWLQQGIDYIVRGVARIFSARDDEYPETGVQPFEGEPYSENQEND